MDATNTIDKKRLYKKASNLKFKKKFNFTIPLVPFKENDEYVFKSHFKGKYYLWPWIIIKGLNLLIQNPWIFFIKLKKFILR